MKKCLIVLTLIAATSCAGVATPGPNGEPSPFRAGLEEASRTYDESPWETFGPWGAGVAGVLAAIAGLKKGKTVYDRRKANEVSQ